MRKETAKYQASNLIRYTADAFFYPFYSLFLLSIGKTEREIGIVLMIIPLIAIFINPLWSFFAKDVNHNKILAIIFSIVEAIVVISLLAFTNLIAIIIFTIIIGIVNQPFYLLFDSYITVYTIESKENYSAIRMFGSLGYALGVVVSGILIKVTGKYLASFFTVFVLYLVVAGILFFIKPLKTKKDEKTNKGNFKKLINNKNYLLFMGFYVISLAVLFGGDAFWGPYFKTRGIDESLFGWISLGVYLIEVVFLFLFSKYGEKIKIRTLMILIILMNVLRFFMFSLNVPFSLLVISSYLRGFTMAGLLYIVVRYLSVYVEKTNITLGMIIIGSMRNFLQMIITLSGGFIIETYSYNIFYLIMGLLGLTSAFFIKYPKKEIEYDIINSNRNEGKIK